MTLIIGKRSNLSKKLNKKIKDSILISSDDIEHNIYDVLKYCDNHKKINIIYNSFQPSTKLGDNTDFNSFIIKSILNTSKLLSSLISNNIVINKLIYTSSSSVYGNNKYCSEEDQIKPMSLHAALKNANEELIKRICINHNIKYTIARVFNMYGGEDKFSVISKIINSYKLKEQLTIANQGNSIRDFIHIDNVVEIYIALLNSSNKMPMVLNVSSGKGVSIAEILDYLKINGVHVDVKNIQRDEINASISDNSSMRKIITIDTFIDVKEFILKELKSL